MDDKNNLYVGKGNEVYKMAQDGEYSLFAALDDPLSDRYSSSVIYDIEFNVFDKCLYAASRNYIFKITPDGKMLEYISDKFSGIHGAVGIDFDKEGNMYIACGDKIFKYTKDLDKTIFIDGAQSKKIRIESILGLEFDSTFKNIYFCEAVSGQLIKGSIKNGKLVKLEVIFADYEYSPEYVAIVDDNIFIIKDPAFKYFYFIQKRKTKRIIIDNIVQNYTGIETIIYRDSILYGTNYDGQTVHRINLANVLN